MQRIAATTAGPAAALRRAFLMMINARFTVVLHAFLKIIAIARRN
jgi:hypothetical protein